MNRRFYKGLWALVAAVGATLLGGMVGGAVTPIVATALFGAYRSATPIALYLVGLSLVSFFSVMGVRRSATSESTSPVAAPAT